MLVPDNKLSCSTVIVVLARSSLVEIADRIQCFKLMPVHACVSDQPYLVGLGIMSQSGDFSIKLTGVYIKRKYCSGE